MKSNEEPERFPISSIKQFVYCQRRFALMYIDCEWESNYKIIEGDIMHEKVDDPFFNEKRGDIHITRSVPIYSNILNLYGVADIVEFIKTDIGIEVVGKKGFWKINPVEYKNGKSESSNADNFQLCAQALCLEEMFNTNIQSGDIYYGKIKRRVNILFTDQLKNDVRTCINNMLELLNEQKIPPKPLDQNCNLCSLVNVCIPNSSEIQDSFKYQVLRLLKGEMNAEIIK